MMTKGRGQARTYVCPVCGGHVAESVRVCPYCRSPVATVRCGFCFHMNLPQSLHCSGCGSELGLEPIPQRSGLRACAECGGQFVDHSLLRDLLEARQVYGLKAARRAANPLDQPVRYRPCPVCRTMMNRQNFGRSSGVIVDICSQHGVWFDAGELPRVLDFVQAGGLLQAKQQEQPGSHTPPWPSLGNNIGGSALVPRDALTAGSSLADAAAELTAAVRRFLRR